MGCSRCLDFIKCCAVRDGQSRYLDELGKGLIDEDQGDEEGKNLLREWRDVADEEAALGRHNHQDNEDEPETDPHPAGQVLVIVGLTELIRKTQICLGKKAECNTNVQHFRPATLKYASSNTNNGPEKPMMRRGCPASSENITPRVAVDTISSVTPIMPSVFSPSKGKSTIPKHSYHSKTESKCLFVL